MELNITNNTFYTSLYEGIMSLINVIRKDNLSSALFQNMKQDNFIYKWMQVHRDIKLDNCMYYSVRIHGTIITFITGYSMPHNEYTELAEDSMFYLDQYDTKNIVVFIDDFLKSEDNYNFFGMIYMICQEINMVRPISVITRAFNGYNFENEIPSLVIALQVCVELNLELDFEGISSQVWSNVLDKLETGVMALYNTLKEHKYSLNDLIYVNIARYIIYNTTNPDDKSSTKVEE